MTTPTQARAMSADEYAASKQAYLSDARSGALAATHPQEHTPSQYRAILDADIAAIEAGGAKFGAPSSEALVSTSSTKKKPPHKTVTPTHARDMSDAQYSAARAAFLLGGV